MTKVPLIEYLKTHSQQELAEAVGYRQSAISNMLRAERNVSVITNDDGTVELREDKLLAKTA